MSNVSEPQQANPPELLAFSQQPSSRKRKKPSGTPLLFPTFQIESCEGSSLIIEPLHIVSRSVIPLHLFDFTSSDNPTALPRIFHARNESLEKLLKTSEATILVVQVNHSAQQAAIEYVGSGTYSLTLFNRGVSVPQLEQQVYPDVARPRKFQRIEQKESLNQSWWLGAALGGARAERDGLDSSRLRKDVQHVDKARVDKSPQVKEADGLDHHNDSLEQSAESLVPVEDLARHLVQQYLEALYLSKTSLAYFPKSTLARTRAGVTNGDEESLRHRAYLTHLRMIILSPAVFDKKYRQSIPEALKPMRSPASAADQATNVKAIKKPKRLKKIKPGKSGLYSTEQDFIERWWHAQEIAPGDMNSNGEVESLQSDLRFRETLLQIILVLEAIALESTLPPLKEVQNTLQEDCGAEETQISEKQRHPAKQKKPANLDNVLEVLVDRICIWQSIEAIDSDSKKEAVTARADVSVPTQTAPASKDKLEDFCHHVLVPFYGSRLRSKVEGLMKRMGAPVNPSPPRPSSKKEGRIMPGAAIARQQQRASDQNPRRSKPQKRAPSLARSVTDSAIRRDSRERSTTPLDEPMKPPRRTLSRASSISSSTKLSQREVDISAISKFSRSRTNRKASVDKELHEAIATLKKPNREKAVQEYVDALEMKKPQLPQKPWLKSRLHVEVGATPRRENKTKDMMLSGVSTTASTEITDVNFTVPSSNTVITSSPQPAHGIHASVTRPSARRSSTMPTSSAVFATPSHRSEKRATLISVSTPSNSERNMIPASVRKDLMQTPHATIAATPQKNHRANADVILQSSPPHCEPDQMDGELQRPVSAERLSIKPMTSDPAVKTTGGKSIYDSLGWNDDDDDELA